MDETANPANPALVWSGSRARGDRAKAIKSRWHLPRENSFFRQFMLKDTLTDPTEQPKAAPNCSELLQDMRGVPCLAQSVTSCEAFLPQSCQCIKTSFKKYYLILLDFFALLMLTSLCFAQQEKEVCIFYTIYPCHPNFDATSIVVWSTWSKIMTGRSFPHLSSTSQLEIRAKIECLK